MAFFDKVGATLSNTGKNLAQSAKTMAAVNNLNGQISAQQEAIHTAYVSIGQAYAAANMDNAGAEFAEQINAIKAANSTIEDLKAKINALKGFSTCASCGAQIPAGSAFCPGCGAKAPAPAAPAAPAPAEEIVCPACGAKMPAGTLFCANCGAKIAPAAAEAPTTEANAE